MDAAPISAPVPADSDRHASDLLSWYDRNRRHLPWRFAPGAHPDPYHVWLSEIMLQQTTVAAVVPYFLRFTRRWPDVGSLADAPLDDVLAAWAGLGYYARARNLHKCAAAVRQQYDGRFPESEEALKALPGIGPYTAAAIAAIAFGLPATPVDGNVERVVSRLYAVTEPLPRAKAALKAHAERLTPAERPGDYAQAMMDLGATVCLPREPKCDICPLKSACRAAARGIAADLPRRERKAPKPTRRGIAYVLSRDNGLIFLRRRPENGLLGGMLEFPSTAWEEGPPADDPAAAGLPQALGTMETLPGSVTHTFTHFHLVQEVRAATLPRTAELSGGEWYRLADAERLALPTAMRKVLSHALAYAPLAKRPRIKAGS